MQNLTPEMLLKAKECKTAEEILNLAKENNIEITQDQATEYYAQINQTSELPDDDLDNVAGGAVNGIGGNGIGGNGIGDDGIGGDGVKDRDTSGFMSMMNAT